MSAPICPRKECGHRLIETTGPWRDRGDWMCHGEHDGKRIWHSLELIQILESKLASAEARVKELEGLRVLSRDIGTITLLLDQDLSTVPPLTLGEAMPRKEGE